MNMKTAFTSFAAAALALAGALTASAVSHKDFGRLVTSEQIEYAPTRLDFCYVRTNVEEVVEEVLKEAESAEADEEAEPSEPTELDIPAEPVVTYVTNLVTVVRTNYVTRGESMLTAKDYLAQGWKRIVDEKPAASASNKVVVATGWAEDETAITRQYAEADAPDPVKVPRKFSKLKIYGAISKLGAWEKVQTWLEGKTVDGVNGWIAFQLAQEVSEDNALFSAWAEEARQLLGLSEADFETLLGGCVLDED